MNQYQLDPTTETLVCLGCGSSWLEAHQSNCWWTPAECHEDADAIRAHGGLA